MIKSEDKYDLEKSTRDCLTLSVHDIKINGNSLLQLGCRSSKCNNTIVHPLTGQLNGYLEIDIQDFTPKMKNNIIELIKKHEIVLIYDIYIMLNISICHQYIKNDKKPEISKKITDFIWADLPNFTKKYLKSPIITNILTAQITLFNHSFVNNKITIDDNKMKIQIL